jgi:hypothetical protein
VDFSASVSDRLAVSMSGFPWVSLVRPPPGSNTARGEGRLMAFLRRVILRGVRGQPRVLRLRRGLSGE